MSWTIDQAREQYHIPRWSDGYFDINDQGCVALRLLDQSLDLNQLVHSLQDQGIRLPVLIRFPDILKAQISALCHAFQQAVDQHQYQGKFTYIYPIKVNQQRYVADAVLQSHEAVGLEAGSKTELLAVLALAESKPGMQIICNGYKDREYIRLALIAQELGHEVYIIIEMPSELSLIIHEAEAMQVQPRLGVRVRLSSASGGKWQNYGGEKAKFGLHASQVMECIQQLKQYGMLDNFKVLHCHLGSQISNLSDIQSGVEEFSQYFASMHRLGVNVNYVDFGGGLGVDYEGTQSRNYHSVNYTWRAYADTIVKAMKVVCEANHITMPGIMTESGRAITAHHAVLVTNVIEAEKPAIQMPEIKENDSLFIQKMEASHQRLNARTVIEVYHEVVEILTQVYQQFVLGQLNFETRVKVEQFYFSVLNEIAQLLDPSVRQHRDVFDAVNEKLAHKLFCNVSIFQSLPDIWALEQVFPILPLSHLDQKPSIRAVLQDLTCDSDGRVDHYVDGQGVESTLPLPEFKEENPYFLAFFMVGAYQEILGDMHNLFGDTDSVHVELDKENKFHVVHKMHGDKSVDVLHYVNFHASDVIQAYQKQLDKASFLKELKHKYSAILNHAVDGYTYLEEE